MCILLGYSLSIGTRRSLLSSSRPQSIVIIVVLAWAETTLASLVALGASLALSTATHCFSTSHDVTGGLNGMVLLHLVIESSGSDWTTGLENA